MEAEDGHPILLRNFQFQLRNFVFYFEVFQKYSNSNSISYPLMEYLTTKILYPHHNWKHVVSLYSKRQLTVLVLNLFDLNKVKCALRAFFRMEQSNLFSLRVWYRILVVKYSIKG